MVSAVVVAVAALVASGSAAGAEAATVAGSGGGFYTPPSPLPAGHDGDLIRSEPSHLAWPVPARATRIMYRSEDTHGKPIAVTGTYFDPTRPWKGGGPRPLVSLAPGTQGQGDQCAPSKLVNRYVNVAPPGGPMVEYEVAQVDTLLAEGAAVVMTDYEGLGTPGVHTYMHGVSEGHAVTDMVRAARRIAPDLSRSWAVVGQSQGGAASLFTGSLATSYAPELDFRGTVATAPVTRWPELFEYGRVDDPDAPVSAYMPLVVGALEKMYPGSFRPEDYLTPKGMDILQVARTGCFPDVEKAVEGLTNKDVRYMDPAKTRHILDLMSWAEIPISRYTRPVDIAQGTADHGVYPPATKETADALTAAGSQVDFTWYPGADHSGVMKAALPDLLRWVAARFARHH